MIRFRDRGARGRHRAAMVDAYHSFSFGDYNDPKHMGFRDLRVLNEDIVMPGVGFPEHGHADMEFVTIVLQGAIAHLVGEGAGPTRSAFLSGFFGLVGTHGLHVLFGIIWIAVMLVQVGQRGLNLDNKRRLVCLGMFWHLLDVVWIGVFTFVYLLGVLR